MSFATSWNWKLIRASTFRWTIRLTVLTISPEPWACRRRWLNLMFRLRRRSADWRWEMSQARRWFDQRYLAGLLVGESRRRRWSLGKRLAYAAASPLIPAVIIARLRPAISAGTREGMSWTTIPALLVGAVFRTIGEVVAYTRGASSTSQDRMDEYELHKLDFTHLSY